MLLVARLGRATAESPWVKQSLPRGKTARVTPCCFLGSAIAGVWSQQRSQGMGQARWDEMWAFQIVSCFLYRLPLCACVLVGAAWLPYLHSYLLNHLLHPRAFHIHTWLQHVSDNIIVLLMCFTVWVIDYSFKVSSVSSCCCVYVFLQFLQSTTIKTSVHTEHFPSHTWNHSFSRGSPVLFGG